MTWDPTYPLLTDTNKIKDTFTQITDNWDAIEDTFATDHRYMGQPNEGEHLKVTFTAPQTTPNAEEGKIYTYVKDFAGTASPYTEVVEMTGLDGEANEFQITSGGRIMPKTVYIKWNGTTATSLPSGATVVRTDTGVYDLTFPEIGGSFLFFGCTSTETIRVSMFTISEQTSTTATVKFFDTDGTRINVPFVIKIRAAT